MDNQLMENYLLMTQQLHDSWRSGTQPGKDDQGTLKPMGFTSACQDKGGKSVLKFPRPQHVYRVTKAVDRDEALLRNCRSLLNKISPSNVPAIAAHFAQLDLLKRTHTQELVCRFIVQYARAASHWCESYADMICILHGKVLAFPEKDGDFALTFRRALMNACQHELAGFPVSIEPTPEQRAQMDEEEAYYTMKKTKDHVLGHMKFMGNLFIRELFGVQVISGLASKLIGDEDSSLQEYKIECACELLISIGHYLDQQEHELTSHFMARLVELCGSPVVSKRVRFRIQDLFDMRQNGWRMKLYRPAAKKIREIRSEARKGEIFPTKIAGQRPVDL